MTTTMTIKCPCGKKHSFTNQSNYNRALKGSGLCNSCARMGQKRTPEQCRKISIATKVAMNRPDVYERFIESYTPENRAKRSVNTKKQIAILKSKPIAYESWMKKQSENKTKLWAASAVFSEKCKAGLKKGRKIRWDNPSSRNHLSEKYKGNGTPFHGKSHSEETKAKLRKATTNRLLQFWNRGRLMGTNTKPERQMQTLLKQNGIEFQTPFVLENKIYDLYLPSYNILIEVDGCYWHSKNVPLSQMNKQQLRRWKNDRYKDTLARKNGYKLLRVWEDEIDQFNIHEELAINE